MRQLFILALAVMASGCATVGGRTVVFLQRGIILTVIHTCTDKAMVYQSGRGMVAEVVGATPADLLLGPAILGDREIGVTVQSFANGRVVGTSSMGFNIDRNSTTSQTWTISDDRTSGGWGQGMRRSRCPR